jgi:hypothetical protein
MQNITTQTYPADLFNAVAESPLFNLPRELRDMIYRFVLVRYEKHWPRPDGFYKYPISIKKNTGIPEHPLLSASKIVRCETYEIFYYENMYRCEVEEFDPAPVILAEHKSSWFVDQSHGIGIGSPQVGIDFEERNWMNLTSWLHMCHRGEIVRWDAELQHNEDAEDKLLQGLFDVAIESPVYCPAMLDCLLTAMRPAMVELNSDWKRY